MKTDAERLAIEISEQFLRAYESAVPLRVGVPRDGLRHERQAMVEVKTQFDWNEIAVQSALDKARRVRDGL